MPRHVDRPKTQVTKAERRVRDVARLRQRCRRRTEAPMRPRGPHSRLTGLLSYKHCRTWPCDQPCPRVSPHRLQVCGSPICDQYLSSSRTEPMSVGDQLFATSISDLRTRSAGRAPPATVPDFLRDEQSMADAAHAKACTAISPHDIDEQIRSFFARSPSHGPNARRSER